MLVEWLVPIAVFWMVGAMYLGGAPIRIEGGGGVRQVGGLFASFALFLAAWRVLYALLEGAAGSILAVALAALGAAILLPLVCRLGFLLFGVRIRPKKEDHHGAATGETAGGAPGGRPA